MVSDKIQTIVAENRLMLTNTLLEFVKTDTLLYAFNEECLEHFSLMVSKVNTVLGTNFVSSCDLNPVDCNSTQGDKIREYLEKLPNHIFMGLYFVVMEIRSVLLGILFVQRVISKEQVMQTAFYEERYQQKQWGTFQEMLEQYSVIEVLLVELEKMCNENISYKN